MSAIVANLFSTSSTSGEPTRPLTLQVGPTRVSIPVETKHAESWVAAEVLREEFLLSQEGKDHGEAAPTHDDEGNAIPTSSQPKIALLASFMTFIASKLSSSSSSQGPAYTVLLATFAHFTAAFLTATNTDVHSLVQAYDPDGRKEILSSYFQTLSILQGHFGNEIVPLQPKSALFVAAEKGEAEIYALFGGQGTNEVYFDELQSLFDIYKPYVAGFLAEATSKVLIPLETKAVEDGFSFYSQGFDTYGWLSGSSPRPSVAYLASIPLSLPLIGLTQLVQYLVACNVVGKTPGEFRSLVKGATGHSQGVVSAVAIASSDSYDDFTVNALKALKLLFYVGLRGQETFPVLSIEPTIVDDAVENGEGAPTPMLAVTGLTNKTLDSHIAKTNAHLPENSKLHISLHNGPRNFVVTGPSRALYGLATALRKVKAPAGLDQSKTPFSKRKAVFSTRFLVVGVPYHSVYLTGATARLVEKDLAGKEVFTPRDLAIPVYNTEDGSDLRTLTSSLTTSLCDQIFTSPIHWIKATAFPQSATHAIDFGPGGASGIGPLTGRNLEGRGVKIVVPGEKGKVGAEIYASVGSKKEIKWIEKFGPKLVKTRDGKIHIDTPFSRLLGKPPIMVAGMTPCTVPAGFVSAILNAGYHVELAGGGHYNAAALRSKVAAIQSQVKPGIGITLNALYINQRQFGFQFPLWQEMRKEGLPIEGFCVAAGVPSSEKATEIISALREAGIKHISFKPGSVEGIRQVVNIAAANPDFPVILQWTGGRAGGHHSCEDVHQPILATYGSIRQQSNISLVAGSGFGGSDDVWPYLTGDWSVEQFQAQPMPFDGVLFASRVMVAKEAETSPSVKQLIVDAPGVEDDKWESTYDRETGGILTVRSELGEPIHKIATRGVKLWREFDDTVFNMPKEKRAAWLESKKDYVIGRLNKDFNKPWFGEKSDGTVVSNIGEMTYEEVTKRMVRLMYVAHQSRWIDISLRNLTGDWLRRVEERFAGVNGGGVKQSILQSFSSLDDPILFVNFFFGIYSAAKEQLLAAEDKAFFLNITQRPGQKPVPFIPVLDSSFEVWFKKDSLWAAEDIEAVFDRDPQRVCILQGPVAVRHSTVVDEPVGEILGNVESQLAKKLLDRYYGGDESKVPSVDYIGAKPVVSSSPLTGVTTTSSSESGKVVYQFGSTKSSLPPVNEWLETLAGPKVGWLRAVLASVNYVQGSRYISNPMKRLFAPRPNQRVEVVSSSNDEVSSVTLFGGARSFGPHPNEFKAVELSFTSSTGLISLTIFEERKGSSIPLLFKFQYRPDMGFAPVHEIIDDRNRSIKEFYWKLWFGDNESLPDLGLHEVFKGPETVIKEEEIERFCNIVGNQGEAFKTVRGMDVQAPMDFAIVTGWQSIMKAIFPSSIDGDLLKLVHLSNGFKMSPGAAPLRAGDVCTSEARVVSVVNSDSGKSVKVVGTVFRDGKPAIEVTSAFLYRGRFSDYQNTFESTQEVDYSVPVLTQTQVGVLQSKDWFSWDDDASPLAAGTTLVFKTESELRYKDKVSYSSVVVKGAAYVRNQIKDLVKVATIDLSLGAAQGNPVLEYLKRHGSPMGLPIPLDSAYSLVSAGSPITYTTHATNEPYSKVSGDFNPIHINPYFADFALLPGTITHGLWSSAATRKYVETVVADNHPERVLAYNVNFTGMVLPGDELTVKLSHTGMNAGLKVIKVETFNQRDEKVIDGTAEVMQPPTTYVFTGQGSQEVGMGMELYNTSPAAKAVWDAADQHLLKTYGFSIIDIVKNNPKEFTVYFGGLRGQAIRSRYMSMESEDEAGNKVPLFPEVGPLSPKYTFFAPTGLLNATQFTQIALVVVAKAAFVDLSSRGLVQPKAPFGGHSLGEYAALASVADVLPISSLIDVVFYRGLTMNRAVQRDATGRSNFSMMAINPSRLPW